MKKFLHVNYLVTLAVEADVLEILVNFIQQTEFEDNDILTYLECVEDVTLDLENLHSKVGKHSKKRLNELLKGDYRNASRKQITLMIRVSLMRKD